MRGDSARRIGSGLGLFALLVAVACGPSASPSSSGAGAAARPAAASPPSGASAAPASGAPATTTAAPTERLRIAWVSPSGGYLPLWVAQDEGLFRQRGLEAELTFTSGPQAVQALLAGEVDVAYTDGAAVVRAGLAGADTVILGSTTNTFPFKLIVNPAIRRVEDLKGKKLGITRAGATTDFAARHILRQAGLAPDADVALIQAGGTPEMLEAMVAGGLDAGLMSEPFALTAVKQGFPVLMDLSTIGVEYPVTSMGFLKPLVREHPAAAAAFVGGLTDAIAWINHNRAGSIESLARYTQTDDQQTLNDTYDEYVPRFPHAPHATVASIVTILDAIRDADPKAATANPADFVDDHFVRELEDSGHIKQLYGE
ncbi:MAG TPA: ABC transporter substrate-binding protein [Chloroflexota bacterium]|jgi:ABC-type nitrate/sulfonate/bicarbonate transport system substrate-binding protein